MQISPPLNACILLAHAKTPSEWTNHGGRAPRGLPARCKIVEIPQYLLSRSGSWLVLRSTWRLGRRACGLLISFIALVPACRPIFRLHGAISCFSWLLSLCDERPDFARHAPVGSFKPNSIVLNLVISTRSITFESRVVHWRRTRGHGRLLSAAAMKQRRQGPLVLGSSDSHIEELTRTQISRLPT